MGSFPLHARQQFLSFVVTIAVLTEVAQNLSLVLVCISFMVKDVEGHFTYLLAICTSSFDDCLFNFAPF
jgi:hypothetical protein